MDPNGARLPRVKIELARQGGEVVSASEADDKGVFLFRGLKNGVYELRFRSQGFTSLNIVEIKLGDNDSVTISAILAPKSVEVLVGIVGYAEPLSTPGTMILDDDLIRRLPIH